jgi:hypothetical protein
MGRVLGGKLADSGTEFVIDNCGPLAQIIVVIILLSPGRLQSVGCRLHEPPQIATVRRMLWNTANIPVFDCAAKLRGAKPTTPEHIQKHGIAFVAG